MNTGNEALVHNYKIETERVQKKIIYHFSDVHLAEFDEHSDNQEKDFAEKQKQWWSKLRCAFAKGNGEPYEEESQKDTYEHFLNMLNIAKNGDLLILTGDICDYISGANLRAVNSALEQFPKPFIFVKGNHEKMDEKLDMTCFSNVNKPVQTFEFEDMIVVGIDDSTRNITSEQNQKLKRLLNKGKPILVAMHIPLKTEGNKDSIEKAGEYFMLNHNTASAEVLEFTDIIRQNSKQIIAVLAGHLHFMNNSEIAEGLTQYVSSQGALGNINRYEIGI